MVATFVLMDRDSRKVHAVEPEIVAPYQSEFDKKLIRGPKYANLEDPISKDYHVRFTTWIRMVMSIIANIWIGFLKSWEQTFDQVYSKENQSQICQRSATRWHDCFSL